MNILGTAGSWWSAIGLIVDIAGFGVLTWDLLPEYRLNRRRRALEAVEKRVERINVAIADQKSAMFEAWSSQQAPPVRGALKAQARKVDAYRNTIDTEVGPQWHDSWESVALQVRRIGALKAPVAERQGEQRHDVYSWDLIRKAQASLEKDASKLIGRRRPPPMLGIWLIVAGFILQLIGTALT